MTLNELFGVAGAAVVVVALAWHFWQRRKAEQGAKAARAAAPTEQTQGGPAPRPPV